MVDLSLQHNFFCVFAPIVGLSANIGFQILSFRLFLNYGLLKSIFVGFVMGIIGMLGFEIMALSNMFMEFNINKLSLIITNVIIYGALGYCYFHFINLGETARRIRILRELYDVKTGLTLSDILERYNSQKMIELRIKRMLNSDQILLHNGHYFVRKPVILYISYVILKMKFLVLGKSSEFK